VERVHAIVLSGGSAFGLDAASGVMRFLEERGVGFETGVARVPIVPAAILFDLGLGRADVRPTADWGYKACLAASDGAVQQGSVGAGTGATVGKALGKDYNIKGGLGSASLTTHNGYVVGALFAVNATGDIVDPDTGAILAGPRKVEDHGFHNTIDLILQGRRRAAAPLPGTSTTIGVVATSAPLTKEQANKLAQMAHAGMARAIRPAHTLSDGDAIFALSVAEGPAQTPVDMTALGALAARAAEIAIVNAVRNATGLAGSPSAREWTNAH
jgi:L-aminopeptidase/D-esterase-like protein